MKLLEAVNKALADALDDPMVFVLSQLGKYGLGGLTTGLDENHGGQMLTFPVCENLMNAAAMGMALAGMRPVVIHERMDFLAVGMDPLVNHIPVWPKRAKMSLPVTIMAVVGKGKGQGPQHSKNLTPWFRMMEGWRVLEPDSPAQARAMLHGAIFGEEPSLYVLHREFFGATGEFKPPAPRRLGLCGASARHERDFYHHQQGVKP